MAQDPLAPLDRYWALAAIVVEADDSLTLLLEPARAGAPCPSCRVPSQRRHSRYTRQALDLPWRGATVRLRIHTRRFFCDAPACPRQIFCERFDGRVPARARRSVAATAALVELALRTSGEAGARLAQALGLPTSPDTLLRLVRAQGAGEVETPRVLGVDDLALRRGQHYATLLINLETHAPLDLLAERTAEVLAAWLRAHPGVEVIARDRAEAYAEGARVGAPAAQQVANRFHLVQNAGAALEELLRGRKRLLERELVLNAAEAAAPAAAVTVRSPPERPPSPTQQQQAARRAARVQRWERAQALHAEGKSLRQIGRELGIAHKTARALLAWPVPPHNRSSHPRPPPLESPTLRPFVPSLQDRWQAGCRNLSRLFREVTAQGYTGSYSLLREATRAWRTPRVRGQGQSTTPTRRRTVNVRWLCLRPPEQLDPTERAALDQLLAQHPELAHGHQLLQAFRAVIATRDVAALDAWLAAAQASGLPPFVSLARGITADRAAVEAALTTRWSTGPVEGHVHRVKLLKRRGYGRAKLDLLRARVLRAS